MTGTATYSFAPWMRRGLANKIAAAPTTGLRPTVGVELKAHPNDGPDIIVQKSVGLLGPGDIVGISPNAIVRTEPLHMNMAFLPNYLPYIEFYDEDFPWRYSPDVANAAQMQLHPWLALAVLAENEFEEPTLAGPLPAITIKGKASDVMPPWAQLWAWAHVHVNIDIAKDSGGVDYSTVEAAALLEVFGRAKPKCRLFTHSRPAPAEAEDNVSRVPRPGL